MIPQTIHYIWFGRQPKPALVERCIASWKRHMPGYAIAEWNEDNTDLSRSKFAQNAYAARKWAFVSDYVRFQVLAEHGGLYLDTDVELLKPIPQEILASAPFTGLESSGKVAPGLVYACSAGEATALYMARYYEQASFNEAKPVTVNAILTAHLAQHGFQPAQRLQTVCGLTIYPAAYFCSYDQDVKEILLTPQSVSIHHYSGSWTRRTWKRRMQERLKKAVGIGAYRQLLYWKRSILHVFQKR